MSDLLFKPDHITKLSTLSRENLEILAKEYEKIIGLYKAENAKLKALAGYNENEKFAIEDQLIVIRHKVYAKSSERKLDARESKIPTQATKKKKISLPSARYPEIALVESDIAIESDLSCACCAAKMIDMGSTEDSEYVTVVQKTYHIVRQKRHKYRCNKCHGQIVTAKVPKRIKSGSSFSDEMMIDVAVSKYADHVPIERYAGIAARQGLVGVQANTLIDLTHHLAEVVAPIYEAIKTEVQSSKVLLADETWWRMMENDPKERWQLWGFFNKKGSFFEAHDTRASEVASNFLKESSAKYLMSDAYSGYGKATKETSIINCYCNAHARRKFIEADLTETELARPVIDFYKQLYQIENEIRELPPDEVRRVRKERSKPILAEMWAYVVSLQVLPKSSIGKAQSYMLKNWVGLNQFLNDGEIPIDNNQSERGLRNPVIGRKNYYGNHSPRGAKTSAVLFTIMESCKQHKINPQTYLTSAVKNILNGSAVQTPCQYASC